MRRLTYALVLLIASAAPAVGLTSAAADEPCVSGSVTSTAVWPVNQYFTQCVPVDVPPPGDSVCVHRYGSFPPPASLMFDVTVCVPA